MPKIIDERIVEMKFDNKQFEQNAQNSLKTLDNLKKSLNFNGAVKGLEQFERVSNGINLSGMESAIQTVQNRFSTMGIIADQIIRRITDSALNMARRIGLEFTIAPIKSGFQEYETQINSVQTILANTSSKGKTLEDVTAALDELNAYADKTIYNFTEMTRNIGTFTAAGVDLDVSTAAIKGIANLAAVSGSNSQQASTAMYQLSQALASGTVKLMDWNSVVNAGMGGEVFQNALKDTARLHGIAIDQIIEDAGSFRESLSEGWLSADILTETLQKFTGDLSKEQLISMGYTEEQAQKIYQMGITANEAATKVKTFTQLFDTLKEAAQSGWTQSWEIIVGDFEEAKELLTSISDKFGEAIGESASARNLLLQQWKDLGGRTLLIESFNNALEIAEGLIWSVKNAFYEIFPKVTADNLFNITSRIWEVTESLKSLFSFSRGARHSLTETSEGEVLVTDKFALLGPVLESISKIFKGFFAIVDAGVYVFLNFGKIVLGALKMIAPLVSIILNFLGTIGDYLSSFAESIKNGMALAKGLEFFEDVFAAINSAIIGFLSVFVDTTDGLGETVPNIKTIFSEIYTSIRDFVKNIYNSIIENGYIGTAIEFFKTSILMVAMAVPMAISALSSLLQSVKTYITENQILEKITGKVKNSITKFVAQIKNGYNAVRTFVAGINKFFKDYDILSKVGSKSIEVFNKISSAVKDFWGRFIEAFNESKNVDTSGIKGLFAKIKARLAPFKGLFPIIEAPIEGFKKLVAGIKNTFNSIKNAFTNGVSDVENKIGAAADVIKSAYEALKEKISPVIDWIATNIDFGTIFRTLTTISALINISKFIKTLGNMGDFFKGISDIFKNSSDKFGETLRALVENTKKLPEKEGFGTGLLKISASIGILVASLWVLSKIDQNTLNDGMKRLGAIAAGFIVFFGVLKLLKIDKSKSIDKISNFVKTTSASIFLLIGAIAILSRMDSDTVVTGLIRIGEILTVLALISKLSGSGGFSDKKPAFIGMAVSVLILAHTLKYLARIDPEVMVKGLIAMSAVLLELAIFTRIANGSNLSGEKRKPAFITMAISVILFADAIKSLGRMKPDHLLKGIAALGAILLEMAVFSRLMSGSAINTKGLVLMLVSLGGSLLLFMEAMNRTANISGAKMMAFSLSFGIIIGTLSKTLTALSLMPFGAILGAVIKLGTIIGLTSVFIGGIGALTQQFPQIQTWLDSGGEALGAVGTAIGKFIQGIVNPNGTSTGSMLSLASLGTDLGNFVTNAQPFFAKMSSLTEGELKNIGGLASAVADLTAAAALSKGKSAAGVGDYLGELGTGLYSFSENAKDIDPKAILGTESSLKMLTRIYKNLPEIGGVVQFIVGRQDLPVFAKGIKALGSGLKDYSDNAKKVDASAIAGTEAGLTMLKDIYNNLTPIGGIAAILFGEVNPFDFSLGIVAMGKGLKRYSENIVDVKPDAVKNSALALQELAKINDYLPLVGGVAGFIFGDENLLKLGEALAPLGEGIASFAGSIKDYSDFSNVSKAATALKDLAGINDNLPKVGGAARYIFGDENLQNLGDALAPLGAGLAAFIDSIGGTTDYTPISAAATALKDLAGIHEYLPKLGGLSGLFGGDEDLGKFGEDLKTLGGNLHTFASNFVGDSYKTIDDGIGNSRGIFESLKTLLSEMSASEENTDYSTALTNFNGIMDTIIFYLETYYPEFYNTGSTFMSNLSDGANSVSDYPVNIFTTTATSVIRSLNSYNIDFYVVGLNYAVGIANGIIRGGRTVVSAAASVANSAINASRRGFDEHSPSKEGFAIGAFFTEGIANGMTQLANLTNRASEQVSSDAIHAAQTAMSMINSIVESGDVAPTIRPVLDLSNVANGAGQINSLLGKNRTLTADSVNVRSFNQRAVSLQAGINQNGSLGRNNNRDVVDAINSLGVRIDTMNEDIKNLKVVLNTGIVAGELAPEINRRLGIIAAYEERGI